ncbi:hypothetical protein A4X13_0g642 [Tilletia indica]|uniref:Uncharacterized protein n=1 Tax=Tilletia indica TaxID=43049 RepID=A0A8T8THI3_9BASI|nr:hypothetical protein A4X13_0g642 [Tilletia indica]
MTRTPSLDLDMRKLSTRDSTSGAGAPSFESPQALSGSAGYWRNFSSCSRVRIEDMPEASSSQPSSAEPDLLPVQEFTAEEIARENVKTPENRAARTARKEAAKVLSRITRFRTKNMKGLKPAEVYKLFLQECPNDFNSLHHHPELWARLLKMAFKTQESASLRLIADHAMQWCSHPAARAFVIPRTSNGDEKRSTYAGVAPLPTTTKSLELLIRNMLQADEFRLQKTAVLRQILSEKQGNPKEKVSIRSEKRSPHGLTAVMGRLDTSDVPPDELTAAQRFAWAKKLKSGPFDGVPPVKIKPIAPVRLEEVSLEASVGKRFVKVRERELAKKARQEQEELQANQLRSLRTTASRAENNKEEEGAWPETAAMLMRRRKTQGEARWKQTLDRFRVWAETAEPQSRQAVERISDLLKDAVLASEHAPSNTSEESGKLAIPIETDNGPILDEWDESSTRPPTYLLMASLRQLVLRGDPRRSLALAENYLGSLLRDAKAGKVDVATCFSAHPTCDDSAEPVRSQLSKEADPRNEANDPKVKNADLASTPSLFLRAQGPTYSVTAPIQPPKGYEILNAVLRAHLRANHPVKDMLATMRVLCGVRLSRAVRAWESMRRAEASRVAKAVNKGSSVSELPFGLLREFETLRSIQWAIKHNREIPGDEDSEMRGSPPPWRLREPALSPAEAVSKATSTIELSERVQRATAIHCFPNEETFLIVLEQVRKQRDNIADAIALIDAAMSVWGPPQIQPILVPTNIHPRWLVRPMSMSKEGIDEQDDEAVDSDSPPPPPPSPTPPAYDPYLKITTATLRKLLRWAIYSRREGNMYRVMQSGEAWIRHSREWRAALRGVPVFTYQPGLKIKEEEVKEWMASNLGINCVRPRLGKSRADPAGADDGSQSSSIYTYTPDPRGPRFSDNVGQLGLGEHPPRLNTWMSVDGGEGYLGPGATGDEKARWYDVLIRARSVLQLVPARKDGETASAEEDELSLLEEEKEDDESDTDGSDAKSGGQDGPPHLSWMTRGQISVVRGRHLAKARQALMAAYESLYVKRSHKRWER